MSSVDNIFPPQQCKWEYNQIIGYIAISVKLSDIWFDIICTTDKNFHADSKRKHFMRDWMITGYHFRVDDRHTNEELQNMVQDLLSSVIKERLNKRFCVDMNEFYATIKYLNLRKLFDDNKIKMKNSVLCFI